MAIITARHWPLVRTLLTGHGIIRLGRRFVSKEPGHRHAEGICDVIERVDGDANAPALQVSDGAPVDSVPLTEALLRPVAVQAETPNSLCNLLAALDRFLTGGSVWHSSNALGVMIGSLYV